MIILIQRILSVVWSLTLEAVIIIGCILMPVAAITKGKLILELFFFFFFFSPSELTRLTQFWGFSVGVENIRLKYWTAYLELDVNPTNCISHLEMQVLQILKIHILKNRIFSWPTSLRSLTIDLAQYTHFYLDTDVYRHAIQFLWKIPHLPKVDLCLTVVRRPVGTHLDIGLV